MKRAALLLLLGLTGCVTVSHKTRLQSVPVFAIPTAESVLDGEVYRGLRDVRAGLDFYQAKVKAGALHPSPELAAAMAEVQSRYSQVSADYHVYHDAPTAAQVDTARNLQKEYLTLAATYSAALSLGGK